MGIGRGDGKHAKHGGRLGDALIEAGYVEPRSVTKALDLQASFGGRLGTNLLEIGAVGETDLTAVLGRINRTQTVDPEALRSVPPEVIRMVPPRMAKRFGVVPFQHSGGSLLVAGLDPGDAVTEDELSMITGALVRTVIGLEVRIRAALERYYRIPQSVRLEALSRRLDGRSSRLDDPADAIPSSSVPPPSAVPASLRTRETDGSIERRRPRLVKRRAEVPREIELTDEEHDRIFGESRDEPRDEPGDEPREEGSPDGDHGNLDTRLETASRALARAAMRDDVADALLAFAAPDFARRLLLIRRGSQILGWRGEGQGIAPKAVRKLLIETDAPSLFANLTDHPQTWRGPLPPFPAHEPLVAVLGGTPARCVALPLMVRGRVIAFWFLCPDPTRTESASVSNSVIEGLERVASMAGLAFEVALLRNKIRTL